MSGELEGSNGKDLPNRLTNQQTKLCEARNPKGMAAHGLMMRAKSMGSKP